MTRRWLFYSAALGALFAFYIFHSGYFSWLMFITGLAFLPLQLLASLPALLTARLSLQSPGEETGADAFRVLVHVRAPLPVCRVRVKLAAANQFTGQQYQRQAVFLPGRGGALLAEFEGAAPGVYSCGVARPQILDLAGLFWLPLRPPAPLAVLVRPAEGLHPPNPDALQAAGDMLGPVAVPLGAMGEREPIGLREYQEGDSLRDVHWKITAKHGKLMVREFVRLGAAPLTLAFACHGSAQDALATLARLGDLSAALLAAARPHSIEWTGEGSTLHSHAVATAADYSRFLWRVLAAPLPAEGAPVLAAHTAKGGPPGVVLLVGPEGTAVYEGGLQREVLA